MPQTLTEKILARKSNREKVAPGDLLETEIDTILAHEVTTPPAIEMLKKKGICKIPKSVAEKLVITPDHFVPNKDIRSAEMAKILREFARENSVENYFEIGRGGICHAVLPERGFIFPNEIVVGADSHSCTHGAFGAFATGIGSTDLAFVLATGRLWFRVPETIRIILNGNLPRGTFAKDVILKIIGEISVSGALDCALEFSGEIIENFSLDERMTLCNMAIEAGAKNGICAADEKTLEFLKNATTKFGTKFKNFEFEKSDENAKFSKTLEFDFSNLRPQIARPNLPENVCDAAEIAKEKIKIDQVFIGSCTNGRLSDLQIVAEILQNKKVARGVRLLISPATCEIYRAAEAAGFLKIFADAGAVILPASCGPCLGGHLGILAAGEKCVSSTNRNFVGRMGSNSAEVFLASPASCAATAICGEICGAEVLN